MALGTIVCHVNVERYGVLYRYMVGTVLYRFAKYKVLLLLYTSVLYCLPVL